jgi:NAD(P)-dependent dehydrogenase (short-subunit alcohol dehydrogenase family)
MRAIGPGAIIHIASISALHGNPDRPAYGAFKGGVHADPSEISGAGTAVARWRRGFKA